MFRLQPPTKTGLLLHQLKCTAGPFLGRSAGQAAEVDSNTASPAAKFCLAMGLQLKGYFVKQRCASRLYGADQCYRPQTV